MNKQSSCIGYKSCSSGRWSGSSCAKGVPGTDEDKEFWEVVNEGE